MARKRAWVPLVPFGETILGATAMAMVMDAYKVKLQIRYRTGEADGARSISRTRFQE